VSARSWRALSALAIALIGGLIVGVGGWSVSQAQPELARLAIVRVSRGLGFLLACGGGAAIHNRIGRRHDERRVLYAR
jgi:hypothetical protein